MSPLIVPQMARSFLASVERLNSLILDAEQDIRKKQELVQSGVSATRLDSTIRKKLEVISIELDTLVIAHHKEPSSPTKASRAAAIRKLEEDLGVLERDLQQRQRTAPDMGPSKPDFSRVTDTELAQMQQKMRERRH